MYMCYYCSDGCENFSELIKHLCTGHNKNEIKYRERELNFSNGKIGYREGSIKWLNYILLQGHCPGILKPKIKAMSSVIHKIFVPSNNDIVIQAMNGP